LRTGDMERGLALASLQSISSSSSKDLQVETSSEDDESSLTTTES